MDLLLNSGVPPELLLAQDARGHSPFDYLPIGTQGSLARLECLFETTTRCHSPTSGIFGVVVSMTYFFKRFIKYIEYQKSISDHDQATLFRIRYNTDAMLS
jgi:hypothetical protein